MSVCGFRWSIVVSHCFGPGGDGGPVIHGWMAFSRIYVCQPLSPGHPSFTRVSPAHALPIEAQYCNNTMVRADSDGLTSGGIQCAQAGCHGCDGIK